MKSVLIITYYWPPAGGPGVQRWLKFVTYFKEFGIEPIVYIPENPHYPLQDESLLDEVPKGITILRQPIKEPYSIAKLFSKKKTQKVSSGIISASKKQSVVEKLLLWVRGNFFIPDARVGWVAPSVSFLKNYIEENKIDTLVTTGPPHSLHLIGLQLKKTVGISWLADFRDPWTSIHYHKSLRLSKKSQEKHKRLEKEVLQTADKVFVTSNLTKKEFLQLTDQPIDVITNGFEENNLQANLDNNFSLVHIGSLLSNRNPMILWEVLSELCLENKEFKNDLEIKLAGIVGQEILDSITSFQLNDSCTTLGYISHQEVLQMQKNAQVLLLIEMDTPETQVIIPGKFFEYMAAKRPILALGPAGSDVATIMTDTQTGVYFLYSEKEQLKEALIKKYQAFKSGSLVVTSNNITKYSRRALTQKMSESLKIE